MTQIKLKLDVKLSPTYFLCLAHILDNNVIHIYAVSGLGGYV